MKMKSTLGLLFVLLLSLSTNAQKRKTAFIEVLGNGLLFSGNFELRLKDNSNSGSGVRVGIGGGSFSGYDTKGIM